MFLLIGGADCCLTEREVRSDRTRLEAAYDILSAGRSSLLVSALMMARLSEPLKPVNILPLSLDAMSRALPR